MEWQYTPYSLLLGAIALSSAALAVYAWRRRRHSAPGTGPAVAIMCAIAIYSAFYALELASASLPALAVWNNLSYVGIAALPFTVLTFAVEYTGRAAWLTRRRMALLAVVPVATVLLRWTNAAHGLFYTDMRVTQRGPLALLQIQMGPFFWVNIAYTYAALGVAWMLLLQFLTHTERLYRRQAALLVLAMTVPWVSSAIYLAGLSPWPELDLTPLGFAVTSPALAWGLFKLGWLDLVPVAHAQIVYSMQDALLVLDPLERVAYLNPAAESVLGSGLGTVQGRPLEVLASGWPALLQWLRQAEDGSAELTHEEGAGGRRVYDARVSRIVHHNEETVSRVVVLRDLTEYKRQEQEREQLQARLSEAQRMEAIGLLAGGVAHEFNNLLTVILGRAELAAGQEGLPEGMREDLATIQRAGERAAGLTRQLLAYGQRQMLVRLGLNLNALIEDLAPELRSVLGQRIQLELQLQPKLELVCGDAGALRQMLMNLTLNARDAMSEGGSLRMQTARVERAAVPGSVARMAALPACESGAEQGVTSGEPCVRLSVSDTGGGMDEETLRHLFEPFFGARGFGHGTGLGLPVVYGIVAQHQGWIDVRSAPGQGTRFDIFLPFSARTADSEQRT